MYICVMLAASDASADCACNAGYTVSNGGTCTACEPGTYKEWSGNESCTACPADSTSPAGAFMLLDACVHGEWMLVMHIITSHHHNACLIIAVWVLTLRLLPMCLVLCACMFVHTYIHAYTYIHRHIDINMHTCAHVYIYIKMHATSASAST